MPDPAAHIIVADDHPLFRQGVRSALEGLPEFQVAGEASDGAEALRLVADRRPEVLLLDLALPDISGLEVLRRLRDARADVLTLVVTAAIDRSQTLEALQLGARGVVMKEAAADVLVKAIRAVLAGEYWVGHKTMADWTAYAQQHGTPKLTLTAREQEVIRHVLEGHSNRDIARRLSLSEETIKTHVSNIYRKLGISNRMELALYVSSGKLKQP
jgi:two-component system nitrate/nitrite response regulator NarL